MIGQSGDWAAAVDLSRFGNKVILMSLNFHISNLKFIKLEVPDCVFGDK